MSKAVTKIELQQQVKNTLYGANNNLISLLSANYIERSEKIVFCPMDSVKIGDIRGYLIKKKRSKKTPIISNKSFVYMCIALYNNKLHLMTIENF